MEALAFLVDFILHIDAHLFELVADYGTWIYAILFVIVFCETGLVVTPFLPGDSLLFASGVVAGAGLMGYEHVLLTLLAADDPMAALEPFKGKNERFDQGVSELSTVVGYLSAFGVPEDHFMVDLTIARGLDYYTGTVYETVMLDHPEVGSICSGGRYDNLAEYYTDKQLPGVGISIGLTRLFSVLEAQGYLNDGLVTAPADVLILPMTEDLSPAISFATALREAGVRAQLHCEKKKFKQKLSYADKLAIPYAAFLGEDEIAQGKVTVKDLTSGEQNTITPSEAVALVQAGLTRRSAGAPITEPQL